MIETTIVVWKCDGLDCDCEKHERYGPESSNSLAVYQQPPGWVRDKGKVYCEECVKKRSGIASEAYMSSTGRDLEKWPTVMLCRIHSPD